MCFWWHHIEKPGRYSRGLESVGLSAGQIKALVDYLDANAIEYILKKGQQEIGIRFLMLFSDFAPTEIFFKGQKIQALILRKKVAIIGQLKPSQGCKREMTFGLKFDFTNKGS